MNVHYIQGVALTADAVTNTATAVDNGADLSVYDDCYDHFQYDIAHLSQYSPGAHDYGTNYSKPS